MALKTMRCVVLGVLFQDRERKHIPSPLPLILIVVVSSEKREFIPRGRERGGKGCGKRGRGRGGGLGTLVREEGLFPAVCLLEKKLICGLGRWYFIPVYV